MGTTKKIDIIIPAYNAQDTIERTIASILLQSVKDLCRITIINDGGGDTSYDKVINRYKDLIDLREIKISSNMGPGVARQCGIDNTDLEYFTCIDADDTFAGAFALEILMTNLDKNSEYHVCIGSFIEEQENLQFINHKNDLIWMFGKMYRRSFINKYDIRFNTTRANEDNGFNTLIRLCASDTEKIMFIDDIVYYWHFKKDSITRINNCEYSYNQSFPGYTDNMIYAVKEAKKKKPFNGYINLWATQVMFNLYVYYEQTCERDSRFAEQNFAYCAKYYHLIFKSIRNDLEDKIFKEIYSTVMRDSSNDMLGIAPNHTIYEFLDLLEKHNGDFESISPCQDFSIRNNDMVSGVPHTDFSKATPYEPYTPKDQDSITNIFHDEKDKNILSKISDSMIKDAFKNHDIDITPHYSDIPDNCKSISSKPNEDIKSYNMPKLGFDKTAPVDQTDSEIFTKHDHASVVPNQGTTGNSGIDAFFSDIEKGIIPKLGTSIEEIENTPGLISDDKSPLD